MDSNYFSTSVRNPPTGIYSFELTVVDSYGLSGKDTVVITVNNSTEESIVINNLIPVRQGSGNYITLLLNSTLVNRLDYVLVKYNYTNGYSSDWQVANYDIPPIVDWFFGTGYWYELFPDNTIRIYGSIEAEGTYDLKIYY